MGHQTIITKGDKVRVFREFVAGASVQGRRVFVGAQGKALIPPPKPGKTRNILFDPVLVCGMIHIFYQCQRN